MSKKITEQKDIDLRKTLEKNREDVRMSRFSMGAAGKNVKAARDLKREIAQIQTELSRRARQEAERARQEA